LPSQGHEESSAVQRKSAGGPPRLVNPTVTAASVVQKVSARAHGSGTVQAFGAASDEVVQLRRRFHAGATSSYDRYNALLGNDTSDAKAKAEIIYTDNNQTKTWLTPTMYSGTGNGQKRSCVGLDNRFMNRPKNQKTTVNAFCAEVQVIHALYHKLTQIVQGGATNILVRVFTTWTPCYACEHDLGVLHTIFPQAEVVVRSGSQYYNQNQISPVGVQYGNVNKQNRLKRPRLTSNQP
jgi:hypothetical protein